MKSHLLMFFSIGNCPVKGAGRVLRLAAVLFEGRDRREERLRGGRPAFVVRVSEDDSLGRHDFASMMREMSSSRSDDDVAASVALGPAAVPFELMA
jgi:hypothetical protein